MDAFKADQSMVQNGLSQVPPLPQEKVHPQQKAKNNFQEQ
jgi:hypothetical protein